MLFYTGSTSEKDDFKLFKQGQFGQILSLREGESAMPVISPWLRPLYKLSGS